MGVYKIHIERARRLCDPADGDAAKPYRPIEPRDRSRHRVDAGFKRRAGKISKAGNRAKHRRERDRLRCHETKQHQQRRE